MKVRYKTLEGVLNEVYHVIEESRNYYILQRTVYSDSGLPTDHIEAAPKGICERVSDERWEDVTARCTTLQDTDPTFHRIYIGEDCLADCRYGYRLRKVKRYEYNTSICAYTDALIVERKVTP